MKVEFDVDAYLMTYTHEDGRITQRMRYVPKMDGYAIDDALSVDLLLTISDEPDGVYKWDDVKKEWKSIGLDKGSLTFPLPVWHNTKGIERSGS